MYSQTRRLTFPMTLSELKPKKCASKGFLVNGGHSHVVQKPLAAWATRGLPGHLRSATGRKQERERHEQTEKIKTGNTLTRENWGRK